MGGLRSDRQAHSMIKWWLFGNNLRLSRSEGVLADCINSTSPCNPPSNQRTKNKRNHELRQDFLSIEFYYVPVVHVPCTYTSPCTNRPLLVRDINMNTLSQRLVRDCPQRLTSASFNQVTAFMLMPVYDKGPQHVADPVLLLLATY